MNYLYVFAFVLTSLCAQTALGMGPKAATSSAFNDDNAPQEYACISTCSEVEPQKTIYYSRKLRNTLGIGGFIVFGLGWATGGYYYLANTFIEASQGGPAGFFALGLIPVVGPILNWMALPQALSSGFHVIMTSISFVVQLIGAASLVTALVMERVNRDNEKRGRRHYSLHIIPMFTQHGPGLGVVGQF